MLIPLGKGLVGLITVLNSGNFFEARMGFEPTYNGFANRCLTTWLPRQIDRERRIALKSRKRREGDTTFFSLQALSRSQYALPVTFSFLLPRGN
jgi:hypothetical protein